MKAALVPALVIVLMGAGCQAPPRLAAASGGGVSATAAIVEPSGYTGPVNAASGTISGNTPIVDRIRCNYFNARDFASETSHAALTKPISVRSWPSAVPSSAAVKAGASASLRGGIAPGSGRIAGGIVPHHLLARNIISAFFKNLAAESPDTVVIFAPNHKRAGLSPVNTSFLDWDTPFGILSADKAARQTLASGLKAGVSRSIMEEEYSISGLVPYIKYYIPDAKILPILLHGDYGRENSVKLGKLIHQSMGDSHCVFIASVDFSHYLPVDKADRMDDITLKALEDNDLNAISGMGNDNLDSPPSIMALLSAVLESKASSMELLEHSNSSRLASGGQDNTTSYFSVIFRK